MAVASSSRTLFGKQAPNWAGYYLGGAHKGREFGNWESDNAWDIFAPDKTPVYAYAPGIVTRVFPSDPNGPRADVVYGDQVSLKGIEGQPSTFYTHITSALTKGQTLKAGDLVGYILKHPTNTKMPIHVHTAIDQKRHIKDFVREDGSMVLAGGAGGGGLVPEALASDLDGFVRRNALTIASLGLAMITFSALQGVARGVFANPSRGRRFPTVAR